MTNASLIPADEARAQKALQLSARWGQRSKAAFGTRDAQALFGIQQGSTFEALRRESTDRLLDIGFDGYAIGGLAVGEGHEAMCDTLEYCAPILPWDRPRYLMGVGKPIDLVEGVARAASICSIASCRPAQAGMVRSGRGKGRSISKTPGFAEDDTPLDPTSACPASRDYSKAYLHHLMRSEEILGQILLSWHNIAFFQALMMTMREKIAAGEFSQFRSWFHETHLRDKA